MKKFIISTGKAVVSSVENYRVTFSDNSEEAITYNAIGDAMRICIQVNNLLGTHVCKVI